MEHEAACALRLAFWRLRYPLELTPEAKAAYLDYLTAHAGEALAWLLGEQDTESLSLPAGAGKAGPEACPAAPWPGSWGHGGPGAAAGGPAPGGRACPAALRAVRRG